MKKKLITIKPKNGHGRIRKAFPLFASFLIAHFALPAGSISDKNQVTVSASKKEAIQFVNFELEIYDLYEKIGLEKAGLSLEVFNKAMVGYLNLYHEGKLQNKNILTIADLDKISSEERFWVIDLNQKQILFQSLVAHGKNSGWEKAENFSNILASEKSSLGFFVTGDTYIGKHGVSLKLDGMDENYNSNAFDRNIVVHGADYVSQNFINQFGRLGRSQGCPALPMKDHAAIIEAIKSGSCLFLHASDDKYQSKYLETQVAMETYYQELQMI